MQEKNVVDLWGCCHTCERWFYMVDPEECCPVCHAAPVKVVDRDEQTVE